MVRLALTVWVFQLNLCGVALLFPGWRLFLLPTDAAISTQCTAGPGVGGAVQERNIKQEKLVFPPEIRLPASKLNRLQRGGLFVLLHQAWLLHGGVRLKEHGAG